MKKRTPFFYEAGPWRQVFVSAIDLLIAYFLVGVPAVIFGGGQEQGHQIAALIIVAGNIIFFVMPALLWEGATIGAKALGVQPTWSGKELPLWAKLCRGLTFFPITIFGTLFMPQINLWFGKRFPYDLIFGTRLTSEKRLK